MARFADSRWQMTTELPDEKLGFGYLSLDAKGGHPGRQSQHSAIRRWTAPENMTADINGLFQRPDKRGDGVRALIVHSSGGRSRILGDWNITDDNRHQLEAHNINLQAGDVLDFIASPNANDQFDSFKWTPGVNATKPAAKRWAAITQFQGPATSPWTHYIQALLASNEFMFVD